MVHVRARTSLLSSLLLLAVLGVAHGAVEDWCAFDVISGGCYRYSASTTFASPAAANDWCVDAATDDQIGYLLAAQSDAEMTAVHAYYDNQNHDLQGAWVGMFQPHVAQGGLTPDRRWTNYGGCPNIYADWNAGEPNDAGEPGGLESNQENCCELTIVGWNDVACDNPGMRSGICEFHLAAEAYVDADGDGIRADCDPCPDDADVSCGSNLEFPPDLDVIRPEYDRDDDGVVDAGFDRDGDGAVDDSDGDGKLDWLDECPFAFDPGSPDNDGDGAPDACENCPYIPNRFQEDSDSDGVGDWCEHQCRGGPAAYHMRHLPDVDVVVSSVCFEEITERLPSADCDNVRHNFDGVDYYYMGTAGEVEAALSAGACAAGGTIPRPSGPVRADSP